MSSFNVGAIQNSLDGFRNALNVCNNSKNSLWFFLIRSVPVVTGFLQLRRKVLIQQFTFRTSETYFLSSAFEFQLQTFYGKQGGENRKRGICWCGQVYDKHLSLNSPVPLYALLSQERANFCPFTLKGELDRRLY